jgi:hypothetical protein
MFESACELCGVVSVKSAVTLISIEDCLSLVLDFQVASDSWRVFANFCIGKDL